VVLPIELGSSEVLEVAMTPSLPPAFVDNGVLTPNSEALFEKELSDLIVKLEAFSTGYGKEIASVLARNASDDIIRKVEKSLNKRKMQNSELATRLAVHTHPAIESPYRSFSTLHLN
jgi:hypothetical protein